MFEPTYHKGHVDTSCCKLLNVQPIRGWLALKDSRFEKRELQDFLTQKHSNKRNLRGIIAIEIYSGSSTYKHLFMPYNCYLR